MAIRVLIADDHPVVRRGLVNVLDDDVEIEVIGQAADGLEAVRLATKLKPDVVLMDLRMPEMDGVQAIREIRAAGSSVHFIILTTYDTEEWIFEGIKAGARGYLLKDSEPHELTSAIKAVVRGESLIEPVVATKLLDRFSELAARESGQPFEAPTVRELDVLRLLARGASNKEIATELVITEKTVKTHVAHLLGKLASKNRTEAVGEAARRGWIKL